MIDLDALISLRAVDAHGSVVAAAAVLGYTPSAVSQQVKRLERQAGVALLERVGRGVMLTQQGRHLVEEGARLLTDLEELEAGLHHQSNTVAGRIRLAAFSTAIRGMVAPAMALLRGDHPALTVSLTEVEPWDTIELVASGQFDVGIVHSWGNTPLAIPEHVECSTLADDVADVLVPADHRLAGRTRVSPKDLADEPWIATPDGTICREWLHRMFDGIPHPPRIAHQSTEFHSHIAMVAAGLGIALVPRLGRCPLPDGVVPIAAHRPVPTREIMVLHRRSMHQSPSVQAVVAALRSAV